MINNKIATRVIAIFIVIIFLLNFDLSYKTSAKWDVLQEDGVAFDFFENSNDITLLNCNLTDGIIKLKQDKDEIKYNHQLKSDSLQGWKIEGQIVNPGQGIGSFIYKFIDSFLLTTELDNNEMNQLNEDKDNKIVITEGFLRGDEEEPCWPMNQFRFKIDTSKNNIDSFKIIWRFGDYLENANLEEISMYIWSYGDFISRWVYLDSVLYNEDQFKAVDGYLGAIVNNKDFISSEDKFIDILIVGNPKNPGIIPTLSSDFIEIDIKIKEGYLKNGNVTSSLIPNNNFYGWEKIIWKGTRPTEDTYVKIHVFDVNDNIIDSLKGNIQGFNQSPIDISSIDPTDYPKIKLRAELHSENLESSPALYYWGVLWQTKQGFYDSFNTVYRMEDTAGVKLADGALKISEFYSDWPIFGKNPANTRSYVGVETSLGTNDTYWFTSKNQDIGGYFLSPIVDNGKVYIGSNDSRIIVFNLTAYNEGDEQPIYKYTPSYYKIDQSVAISDKYLIFGTSQRSSNNNQVIALDKSDLNKIYWNYKYTGNNNTICYSSSPTISNDRVFLTSWNGIYGESKFISYFYSKFDKLFGYKFNVNNLLIAIDINSGKTIWDPIKLPAVSYCNPAVENEIIYVGCDSFEGPSFFAFDENTGIEIWNASIGLLGRTSPVVADGKVFVTAREQSLFSLRGNDIVYAFNSNTGEMIWNFTISENNSVYLNKIRNKRYGMEEDLVVSSFTASPSYYNRRLFVLSSQGILYAINTDNGSLAWSFDVEKAQGSLLKTYNPYLASPVVVNNTIYIATSEEGIIYALDNLNSGNILWEYSLHDPDYFPYIPQGHKIYSSPVVSDGLVLISELRNIRDGNFTGRLFCIGEHKTNSYGKVLSVPIHVQKGKWWNTFKADCTNTEHNKIIFSILDENGIPYQGMDDLNGSNNNISGIKNNVIQLLANFFCENISEGSPVLNSWEISWLDEDKSPQFINNSFKPGQEGWISPNIKNCSIKVKDYGTNIISGLDVNSATFKLEYLKGNNIVIKTFDGICDGINGVIETTITAELSDLGININDMKNISFSIKDLAGNEGSSSRISFKIDAVKPTSEIINNYNDIYTSIVTITAEGNDALSGIAGLSLYYRAKDENEWKLYGSEDTISPYSWGFINNVSNHYEFCSIAKDKAGNTQDFPYIGEISFLYDENPPYKPVFNESYSFKTIPEFSIEFIDDYELKSVEYRLNFHGLNEWNIIADNINLKNYTGKWTLDQSDWNLMEEDNTYYIYFKLVDFCNNTYITQSDDEALKFVKDELYPIINVKLDLSDFDGGGMKDEFFISATTPDNINTSYLTLKYSYSLDKNKWGNWIQYGDNIYESPYNWNFKTDEGSGYYKFKVIIVDTEGRTYESPTEIKTVTKPITSYIILLIILIIIMILVSLFVLKKFKTINI